VHSVSWDRKRSSHHIGKVGERGERLLDLDRVSDLEMDVSFRARARASEAFDQRQGVILDSSIGCGPEIFARFRMS
jgi:hypothetical protein